MKPDVKSLRCIWEGLEKIEAAMETPYAQWRDKEICRDLLKAYDTGSGKVGKAIAEALYGSTSYCMREWGSRPWRYPNDGDLEEKIKGRIKEALSSTLPVALEEWLTGVNDQTLEMLNSFFTVHMLQNGFPPQSMPCLYMGEMQLWMAKEIGYDVLLALYERVDSFGLDVWLRDRKTPKVFRFITRRRTLRRYLEGLEELLEEDRFEFEIDIGAYFLCSDFLDAYKDCVIDNILGWIQIFEEEGEENGLS